MATSKRTSSANKHESEAKRARVAAEGAEATKQSGFAEYEIQLNGEIYVNVDLLFNFPALKSYFAKRYKRSVKRLIDDEKLQVVFVTKKDAEQGELRVKPSYAPRSDLRLAKKDEHIVRLFKIAKESSYPLAPPVIKDQDLSFFVDKSGVSYQVEMRGERTRKGIYFKAKDVGQVFESGWLVDTILRSDSTYHESIDYVWFTLQVTGPVREKQSVNPPDQGRPRDSDTSLQEHDHHSPQKQKRVYRNSQEVFLTFAGLMHALHCTRSSVANEFCDWVYDHVFTLAYGTVQQKRKMLSTLCKVDKSFLEAFMKLVPNDLACLYLVDTAMRENGKKVFKLGRSEKVKERFYKHNSAFGERTILDTVILVPSDNLVEAEALLKATIYQTYRFVYNKARELIHLDTESHKSVRTIMQTIADKYNGSLAIQAEVHAREMKDQDHEYKLRIKDLESMIAVLEERIQNAVADEKAKAAVLLVQLAEEKGKVSMLEQQLISKLENMELQQQSAVADEKAKVAALLVQLAEEKGKLENMKLHQKIADLERAAELKEKDRVNEELRARINELEETNRRLSKNFPEAA